MRELDFVPPWYRDLLRRRRTTIVHLCALGLLVAGVAASAVHRRGQVRAAEQALAGVEAELTGTRAELQKLDALRQLRDQWRRQEEVLLSTGVNIEPSRLLTALSKVVPPDTTLTGISIALQEPEHVKAAPALAPATAGPTTAPVVTEAAAPARSGHSRRLSVSLRGIAPGELAVANVLAGISKTPLFKNVNLTYAKDREENDRTVREFEVTFVINLDPDAAEERE